MISFSLVDLGADYCTPSAPCNECQGDCDSDADCAGKLKCFQRDNDVMIPGCGTRGVADSDYCYDDGSANLVDVGSDSCIATAPCNECQGDCDSDADCAGRLICLHREGDEVIHGCGTGGTKGWDYCYDDEA